jgi:hypothetical protein
MAGQLGREVGAVLSNIAGASMQGTITTGGFSFDEPTLRSLITDWTELAEDYDRSMRDSQMIAQIVGPGLDYASAAQADAANRSGLAYLAYLEHNRDYCYREAQLCRNALDDYLGVEHDAATEIAQSGQQLDDGPVQGI